MAGALIVTVAAVATLFAILALLGARSRRAARRRPGVEGGRLAPCSPSPNCVSSQAGDPRHFVEPFPIGGDRDFMWRRLRDVVLAMPRVRILSEGPDYLHAEFVSKIFGFADDVEFLLDSEAGDIQIRSASRAGWFDFGTNRARVCEIGDRLRADARS